MPEKIEPPKTSPGSFESGRKAIDDCHAQSLRALEKLSSLSCLLVAARADAEARRLACEVIAHFAIVARCHHDEEERSVFPALLKFGDGEIARSVMRLQLDHERMARDWRELEPQLIAVAEGQFWYDTDVIFEGAVVFGELIRGHFALEDSLIGALVRNRCGRARPR